MPSSATRMAIGPLSATARRASARPPVPEQRRIDAVRKRAQFLHRRFHFDDERLDVRGQISVLVVPPGSAGAASGA